MGVKRGTTLVSPQDRKLLKQFGLLVRQKREKLGWTLYDVTGDDLGVKSCGHWQFIESGKKNISLTTFFKICRTLEIHPSILLKKFDMN